MTTATTSATTVGPILAIDLGKCKSGGVAVATPRRES
jgi:hypothetical protein